MMPKSQCTITPLNRPMFTRFGAVARWDFQGQARLILPNKDGGYKDFCETWPLHFWGPPDTCLGAVSGKSDSNEKKK